MPQKPGDFLYNFKQFLHQTDLWHQTYFKSQKLQKKLEAQAELSNTKEPSEVESPEEQTSSINQQQLILDQTKTVISRTNKAVKGVFSSFKNLSWWSSVVNSATEQIKTLTEFQYVPRKKAQKFGVLFYFQTVLFKIFYLENSFRMNYF